MYNPHAKGRWYRIFMESDGTKQTVVEDDLGITLNGNNINAPEGFHIVDTKYDINCIEHTGVASMAIDLLGYADGTQGIAGPIPKAFDWAYIYVFGYFH